MLAIYLAFIVNSSWVGYDDSQQVRDEERSVKQKQKPRERSFIRELMPDWRPTRGQLLWTTRFAILLVVTLGVLTLIGLPFGITLWEWLKLLIIPVVIAAGGLWFNRQQRERELEIAEHQRERDLKIAEQRTQDEALEANLEQISQLLIDKERLSVVGRARTLALLPRLDSQRKGIVVRFLCESGLINKNNPVLHLADADLSGANLRGANLMEASLRGGGAKEWTETYFAGLRGVSFRYNRLLSLDGADFTFANLRGADLRSTDLQRASLSFADLNYADFMPTSATPILQTPTASPMRS
jgi:hypothetical protein